MSEALPITFRCEGLFESDDPKSQFLVSKLEAWLNFRGLCANWYADESLVVNMHICLLPESLFLSKHVDQNKSWQQLSEPMAVYHHDIPQHSFECYLMLSKLEIEQAMAAPQELESQLQVKLAALANHLVRYYHLAAI